MVRLKEIAEACGVSVATVSRALNGLTDVNKERTAMICRVAQEMGYYPNAAARTLKTSRSCNIGILYEDRMNHEYFSSLLDKLRFAAEQRGYDLTLIGRSSSGNSESYYDHARRRNLDGVIIIQADFDSPNVIHLVRSELPTVTIDHVYEGRDSICSSNRIGAGRIVRYAWEKGHRRIAFVTGQGGEVTRERIAGFRESCAELGIRVPEGFVREGLFHNTEDCVRIILEMLQGEERPTCVLCPDDYSCMGVMWALKERGLRIPEDLSLAGFDGVRMTQIICPLLTTYCQNTEGIAAEAVNVLLDAVENPQNHRPGRTVVEGRLQEGGTVCEIR